MADAIGRTLFRLLVSHRHLLDWLTAGQAMVSPRLDLLGFYRQMNGGAAIGIVAAIVVWWVGNDAWAVAAPFVIVWIASPAIARWTSLSPLVAGRLPVSDADARTLRLVARRTWRFFETFVTATDHMLPPDNFQEDPKPILAHRTSPTNLGLYLLSAIGAHDFGWIGTHDTVDRLEATFETMNRLERFRGHFYNWYETRNLRPLDPKYVSSVDSGNLAGHLIALGNACREIIDRPIADPIWLSGIEDAVALTRESLPALAGDLRTHTVTPKQLDEALDALSAVLQSDPRTPAGLAGQFAELRLHADSVIDIAQTLTTERGDGAGEELLAWAHATRASIETHRREVELLMPWASLVTLDAATAPVSKEAGGISQDNVLGTLFDSIPTLGDLPDRCAEAIGILARRKTELAAKTGATGGSIARIDAIADALARSADAARALERRLTTLGTVAGKMFDAMKFDFLLDPARHLLSIGYRVADGSLDFNCYDLLASEARLASFVAIAKGDVPARHWFRLGRGLTPVDRGSALISWSGSMFEYLMPSLVMRAPAGSLLEQTNRLVVRRQMKYGAQLGVPWGVSESAYNARDLELTYQYSNFGVPGLGLKRGLSENAVIAPYATALGAMVDPEAAARNFSRL